MFARLRHGWHELANGEPGKRFQARHRQQARTQTPLRRWTTIIAGVVLALAGIVLLPMPGPGMLVIAVGAGLIAEESAWMSKLLDETELWARRVLRRLRGRKHPAGATR